MDDCPEWSFSYNILGPFPPGTYSPDEIMAEATDGVMAGPTMADPEDMRLALSLQAFLNAQEFHPREDPMMPNVMGSSTDYVSNSEISQIAKKH